MNFQEELMPYISQYGVKVIGALLFLAVMWIVAGISGRLTLRGLNKTQLDRTLTGFLANAIRWLVLLLGILTTLTIFGVETTSFAAVLGAGGLAIGLAFQGSLSNLAAGTLLLVFRPFKIGDVVRAAGETGKVVELGLFTTNLDTPDNRRIIVPNSAVFGSTIENITFHPTRRIDVTVGCDYGADLDKTREVLTKAAHAVPGILSEPGPAIVLLDLGASSVDWAVRVWSKTPEYWAVRDALIRSVKMSLDEAGIGIPFPQMDVHLPDHPAGTFSGRS